MISIFFLLIIIILIIWGARKSANYNKLKHRVWYFHFAFSKDDMVSQLLLLLGFLFLGISMQLLNKYFDQPVEGLFLLFLAAGVALVASYYWRLFYTFIFSLLSLVFWLLTKATFWTNDSGVRPVGNFTIFILIILLFYLLSRWHKRSLKFKKFSIVYLIFSLIAFTGVAIYMSTKFGLYFFERLLVGLPVFSSWQLILSLVILSVFIIGLLFYLLNRHFLSNYESAAIVGIMFLFLTITLLIPEQNLFNRTISYLPSSGQLNSTGVLWAIIFNILAFLYLLGLIFLGYLRREAALINFGAVIIFVFIFVKYFDWFFSFFDKSLFFIGAGIILFVLGWFMEKGRRTILNNLKEEGQFNKRYYDSK